ncbi:hypothetical protein H632_c668p1 [Helicosporidium sp. ATCC 50920]|nr:hypothetical protein H632_c668p1 [Helicosporidium sp. ATCC 50920]|eukprot:KDD75471.1 hypothetical protein H632_c668p1 [Helicosporidium sp. ATCC 50920]
MLWSRREGSHCCTNPFVKRGVARAEAKPSIHSWVLVRYITTPAYIVPQSLNIGASVLFSWGLRFARVSAAAPVANGLSIASNAVVDHALGDRLRGGRACLGVVLDSASSSPMDLERAQQSELAAGSQDPEAAVFVFAPLAVGHDELEVGAGGLHSFAMGEEWVAPGGASMPASMQHLFEEDSDDEAPGVDASTHASLAQQRHVPTRADGTLDVAAFLADVEDPIQALEEELAAERQQAREALPEEWRRILRDVEVEGGLVQALGGLAIEEESGVEEPGLGEQEESGVEELGYAEQDESGVEEPGLAEQDESGVEEPAAPLHEGDTREEATLRDQLELLEASLEGKPERPTVTSRSSESERGEESPEQLFQRLRPVCSELLMQRENAVRLAQSLRRLARLLAPSNPAAMAQCVEYVSFPVLAILDACVDKHCEQQEPHAIPAAASEDVFEAALACMLVLIGASRSALPDRQVLLLLHRLSKAVAAQPVGEEVRDLEQGNA